MDPGLAAEGFTRLTYEIEKASGGPLPRHWVSARDICLNRSAQKHGALKKFEDVRELRGVTFGQPF
jgi:hypothetical protein